MSRVIKGVFDPEKLMTGDPRVPAGGIVKGVKLVRGELEILYYHDDLPDTPFSVALSPDEHFKAAEAVESKPGKPKKTTIESQEQEETASAPEPKKKKKKKLF